MQRAFAAGLCALLVLAHIASGLHLALVRHAVCAEHGETIHATAVDGLERAASFEARTPERADDHDHGCAVLAHLRSAFCSSPPAASADALCAEGAALATPPVQHRSAVVLDYAPKNSPPTRPIIVLS